MKTEISWKTWHKNAPTPFKIHFFSKYSTYELHVAFRPFANSDHLRLILAHCQFLELQLVDASFNWHVIWTMVVCMSCKLFFPIVFRIRFLFKSCFLEEDDTKFTLFCVLEARFERALRSPGAWIRLSNYGRPGLSCQKSFSYQLSVPCDQGQCRIIYLKNTCDTSPFL